MEGTGIVIDLTNIVTPILLSVLTGAIGFVGTFLTQFLKSKLNASQLGLLEDIAANVVLAVEQNNHGKELISEATDKKNEAFDRITELLKKYSITLTPEQIDTAIEAAVANVINANKLIEPPKVVEIDTQAGGQTDVDFHG